METVCIIPARGVSKGIPAKKIMNFCGKPLLAWSILRARQAKSVNAVYETPDDEAMLRVAEDLGTKTKGEKGLVKYWMNVWTGIKADYEDLK